MRPKALCFDLDRTLLNTDNAEVIPAVCRDLAVLSGIDAARLLDANHDVWRAYWPLVEQGWTLGGLDGATVSREAWRRTLEVCGRDDDELAMRACELTRLYDRQLHCLYDDALAVLERLRGRLPLAVITNGASDTQRDKLGYAAIDQHFAAIVISGEHGIAKPDAAIFQVALDQLGVAPDEAWHIGDSLASDVAGARAAGLTSVWLNRGGPARRPEEPQPAHEIASLAELLPLLE